MGKAEDSAWHEQIDAAWHDSVWPEIQGANRERGTFGYRVLTVSAPLYRADEYRVTEDDPLYRILDLKRALKRGIGYLDDMAEAIRNERGE